jgi:hypothetical protein
MARKNNASRYVVSKYMFPGTTSPGAHSALIMSRSAARPWCTGKMFQRFRGRLRKIVEAGTSSVALIALEQRTPLSCAHGRRTTFRQEIDENSSASSWKRLKWANRFDGLDAEGLEGRKQGFGFEDASRARHSG